jgi:membrane fusion protein, multidrug efflux system
MLLMTPAAGRLHPRVEERNPAWRIPIGRLLFGRKRRNRLPRWLLRGALSLSIVFAFLVGVSDAPWSSNTGQATDDAYLQADITPIASHVEGYLAAVPVKDNQRVKAGQVLAQVEESDYRARLDQATQNVNKAQAALLRAVHQKELQKAEVEAAVATIAATQADLDFALKNQTRYHYLLATGPGTHQEAEQADATAKKLTATLDRQRAELQVAQQQVAISDTEVELAKADLNLQRAILTNARIELQWTTITAPVEGTVGERLVRPGEYVRAGTEIIDIVPLPNVWVVANFRESQLGYIRPGQRAIVKVDALPGVTFIGKVDSLRPASGAEFALLPPDNATGNFTKVVQRFPVKIVLDPGQLRSESLKPGMSVLATVCVDQKTRPFQRVMAFVNRLSSWIRGMQ